MKKPVAVIYARISKEETGVAKVEDQIARCKKVAAEAGYEVVKVYADDGLSAFKSKVVRPGWDEMWASAARGEFNVLVFDRQDRLARDQDATMEFLVACRRRGISWHSVSEGQVDLAEPMHVMIAVFRGSQSEAYSSKIAENVARRNRTDRERGLPGHGPRPFGYTADRLHEEPAEADLIRRAVKMLLSGASKFEVVREFNESGLATTRAKTVSCPSGSCSDDQPRRERARCPDRASHEEIRACEWRPSAVYDAVGRWRNAGIVEHMGEPVGVGIWPAIVSVEDIRAVRTILATPAGKPSGPPPKTLLTNLARCHCGERMHAHGMQWGRVYRCASMDSKIDRERNTFGGRHTAIKIELLDQLAINAVTSAYLLGQTVELEPAGEAPDLPRLLVAQSELLRRSEALVETRLASVSKMSVHAFRRAELELEREATDLAARIDAATRRSAHAAMLLESRARWLEGTNVGRLDLGTCRDGLRQRFDQLSLEDRRRLVRATVQLTVRPGRGIGRVEVRHILVRSLNEPDPSTVT